MGIILKKIREIEDLQREQDDICDEIVEISKNKPLMVVADTYGRAAGKSQFNYKGRPCLIQDIYVFRGEVWIKPKFLDLRTKKFTIETSKFYRSKHFREITSYKDVMKYAIPD